MSVFHIAGRSIDTERGVVAYGGREVRVFPRSMQVLALLIEREGQVVGTRELLQRFWRGDLTPNTAVHKCITELRTALGDDPKHPTVLETVPKRGYRLMAAVGVPHERGVSLALLPLRARGGDQEEVRGAALITDALAQRLLALPNVRVLPPPFAANVPGEASTAIIAAQLGADYVLDGHLQRTGTRIRYTFRLLRGSDGAVQYADHLDYDGQDPLQIQDAVTDAVGKAVMVLLSEVQRDEMHAAGTRHAGAYVAYREADQLCSVLNYEALQRAVPLLQQAVAKDPDFARAYERLAQCYRFLRWFAPAQRPAIDKEMDALYVALLARAPQAEHTRYVRQVRGFVAARVAEQERHAFDALRSGATEVEAYISYGRILSGAKLYADALRYVQRADELEPGREIFAQHACEAVLGLHGSEQAIALRAAYLDRKDAGDIGHLSGLAMMLAKAGQHGRADEYLRRLRQEDGGGHWARSVAVIMKAAAGLLTADSPEIRTIFARGRPGTLRNALLHMVFGDVDAAAASLRQLDDGDFHVFWLHIPTFESLMPAAAVRDPRYQSLLNEIGIGADWHQFLRQRLRVLAPHTGIAPAPHDGVYPTGATRA